MERLQFERREKIATALVFAAAGMIALVAKKEGKTGIARLYPGGTFFADIIKDVKEGTSTRLAFIIKNANPLELDFGDIEHTDEQLNEVAEVFELEEEQYNPLQTA